MYRYSLNTAQNEKQFVRMPAHLNFVVTEKDQNESYQCTLQRASQNPSLKRRLQFLPEIVFFLDKLGPVDIHFNQRQMAATSTKDKYDEANLS